MIDWSGIISGVGGSSNYPGGVGASGAGGSSNYPSGAGGYDPWGGLTGGVTGDNDPWSGVTGDVEGYHSGGNTDGGSYGILQALVNPLNPFAVALMPADLVAAAVDKVMRGEDPTGKIRDELEKHGGIIAKIALAFGIGTATATALLIAGGGVALIVFLKLK